MLKINLNLPIDYNEICLVNSIGNLLGINISKIKNYVILKKSLDSRRKNNLHYVMQLKVDVGDEKIEYNKDIIEYVEPEKFKVSKINKTPKYNPVIVGCGPSGLFCGLALCMAGFKPTIVERGREIDYRIQDVNQFFNNHKFNSASNIQFGEGGAGTFSDGKLNTNTKNFRNRFVLEQFVKFGAPKEILYLSKPHIGTDYLVDTIKNLRKEIESYGGKVLFEHKLTNLITKNGKVEGVVVNCIGREKIIDTNDVILATGHSARDTFYMLYTKGLNIIPKSFSMGVRIEHLQEDVNNAQYGINSDILPSADYKLATHLDNGRSVYTFCMCPGGSVVGATSEENAVVTNGMSNFNRAGKNANSAVLVEVNPSDFSGDSPLAGVEYQRRYEHLAYAIAGGNYKAPCQKVGDFLNNKITTNFGKVESTYLPGVEFCDLSKCLPNYVTSSLKQAIKIFDKRIKGFADYDALMTGIETRSSSPIRMVRDENGLSNIGGIYPCGEGAGYAGGIMSASVDGIKIAENIIKKYQ